MAFYLVHEGQYEPILALPNLTWMDLKIGLGSLPPPPAVIPSGSEDTLLSPSPVK